MMSSSEREEEPAVCSLESMELFLWPCTRKSAGKVILQRSEEWGLLKMHAGDFLVVQRLGLRDSTLVGSGSIPGWENKILHAMLLLLSLQLYMTLCDPLDGSPPDSPVPGILRQEHWSGLPFPSPMHESEN